MASVLTEISQWANTLDYWEQAALEKIVNGASFSESDCDELLQYLLEDKNLAKSKSQHPTLHFPQDTVGASQAAKPIQLLRISKLQK